MGELFKAMTGMVLWAIAIGHFEDVKRFAVQEARKAITGPSYLP